MFSAQGGNAFMLLIGDKILECRKAAGLSQEEFAAKVGGDQTGSVQVGA